MYATRKTAPLPALATLAALGLAAALPQAARAQQVTGTSSGVFSGVVTGADNPNADYSGVGTNTLTFGTGTPNKFVFGGGGFNTTFGTAFNVGTFTYTNGTTNTGTGIDSAMLKTTLVFTAPNGLGSQSFTYNVPIVVTTNNTGTAAGDADYITLPTSQPSQVFTFGNTTYTLQLSGFNVSGLNSADGFLTNGGTELRVYEGHTASAGITGTLTQSISTVPEPGTWAAFAFTGLGAAALMLRARRRRVA